MNKRFVIVGVALVTIISIAFFAGPQCLAVLT